jgi:hypothetical protein
LAPAVTGRHLVVTSLHEPEAQHLARLHVDGAMRPVDGDFLGVITQNASGNKIDWFLRRKIRYEVEEDDDGRLRATVTVALKNEAPAVGLPDYVIGNVITPPLPPGSSKTYLSIYTPWPMEEATIDGQPLQMESEEELGRRVYSRFVVVPPGGVVVVRLRLTGRLDRSPYRIDLHRQPGVVADDVTVSAGVRKVWKLQLDRDTALGSSVS